MRGIADDKDPGVAWNRQIPLDLDATGPVLGTASEVRSGDALLPAAQMILVDRTNSLPIITPSARISLTGLLSLIVTPMRSSAVAAFADRSGLNPGRMQSTAFHEQNGEIIEAQFRKIRPHRLPSDLRQRAGQLYAGGTSPTITKVRRSRVPVAICRRSASSNASSILLRR